MFCEIVQVRDVWHFEDGKEGWEEVTLTDIIQPISLRRCHTLDAVDQQACLKGVGAQICAILPKKDDRLACFKKKGLNPDGTWSTTGLVKEIKKDYTICIKLEDAEDRAKCLKSVYKRAKEKCNNLKEDKEQKKCQDEMAGFVKAHLERAKKRCLKIPEKRKREECLYFLGRQLCATRKTPEAKTRCLEEMKKAQIPYCDGEKDAKKKVKCEKKRDLALCQTEVKMEGMVVMTANDSEAVKALIAKCIKRKEKFRWIEETK